MAGDEHFRIYVDHAETRDWEVEMLGVELVHQVGHLLRGHASRAREIGIQEAELTHWIDASDAEINDDLETGHPVPLNAASADELGMPDSLFGEEYFFQGTPRLAVRVTAVAQLTVIRDPGTSPMVMTTTEVSDQKKET